MAHRGVLLLTAAIAAACSQPPAPVPAHRYPIRGQLLGVQLDTGQVVLKHEAVAGYMDAMTMPFTVADRATVQSRRPGDLVTATLVVEPTRSFLEDLVLTGTAPLPPGVGAPLPADGVHVLAPGDPVPGVALTSQSGQAASLADWKGHAGVVTFIYTRCPLPDFCPLMDCRFQEIQAAAASDPALTGKVRLLSVSFDPAFDTPAVLTAHAARVGAKPGWTFATAPPPVVDRFAAVFGVNVIREADGTITHNLRTAVIGPDGRVAAVYSGNDWTARAIVDDLRRALGASWQDAQRPPPARRPPAPAVAAGGAGAADGSPPASAFTPAERALVRRLRTPLAVQRWLNALPYNTEEGGETLRTFRGVAACRTAHCLEAALFAAVVLEQHGHPPLLLSFESQDRLDHVLFVFRGAGGWGSIARSRDPGLHGRLPCFATPRALALSYVDPYVDYSGRVRGYGVVHLDAAMGGYDWRFATGNVWAVEQALIDWPHHRIRTSDDRYRRFKRRYAAYRARHGEKPVYYQGRDRWAPLPDEFAAAARRDRRQLNRGRTRAAAS